MFPPWHNWQNARFDIWLPFFRDFVNFILALASVLASGARVALTGELRLSFLVLSTN